VELLLWLVINAVPGVADRIAASIIAAGKKT
jgi:hypothetical protein